MSKFALFIGALLAFVILGLLGGAIAYIVISFALGEFVSVWQWSQGARIWLTVLYPIFGWVVLKIVTGILGALDK